MDSISHPRGEENETVVIPQLSNEELALKIAALKNHAFSDASQSKAFPSNVVYSDVDNHNEFPYSSEWYRGKGDLVAASLAAAKQRERPTQPTSKSNLTSAAFVYTNSSRNFPSRITEEYSGVLLQRNSKDFRSNGKQNNCESGFVKSRTNLELASNSELPSPISRQTIPPFSPGYTDLASNSPCYLSKESTDRNIKQVRENNIQENNNFPEHSLGRTFSSSFDSHKAFCSTPCNNYSTDIFLKSKLPSSLSRHLVRLPTDGSILEELNRRYNINTENTEKSANLSRENTIKHTVPSVVISPALPHEDEVFEKSLSTYPNMVVDGDNEVGNGDEKLLNNVEGFERRERSMSSASSVNSYDSRLTSEGDNEGLSTDEEISDETVNETFHDNQSEKTRKNWRKIRTMIHWTPFVQHYKKKYPWIQLAGHQGSFKAGDRGTILKKASEREHLSLENLMHDILRPYIPEYKGEVEKEEEKYLQMQDLIRDFDSPSIMDCKMGIRTYLEEDVAKAGKKPRKDLYQKMIDVDPKEPTPEEHETESITKPRYMQFREKLSSSATLGFRIEGIKNGDDKPNRNFKKTKTKEDIAKTFKEFVSGSMSLKMKYLRRLKAIRATLEISPFFKNNEVIGSSLLFVHDSSDQASVWMIDFGKTVALEGNVHVDHRSNWVEGNHEDGYLLGLDNLIETWSLV